MFMIEFNDNRDDVIWDSILWDLILWDSIIWDFIRWSSIDNIFMIGTLHSKKILLYYNKLSYNKLSYNNEDWTELA